MHIADENTFYYDLSDEEIIELLQTGPLTITISADGWSYYSSGVFECSYYASRNHAVQLIGYTSEYWIVKNSWGADWGEDGFIRITRNRDYNCLIGAELFDFEKFPCGMGCETCENDTCTACKDDEGAEVVEGRCQCKDSQDVMIYGGSCVACRVAGCDKCKEGEPEECESCVQGATKVDGECVCNATDHQINPNGECELCEVEGCSSCAEGNSAVCVQCSDCSARVVEGSCKCATGYVMQERQCVLCPILGCEECALEGETATCTNCGEGKVEEDGVCRCEEDNMELQNMFCQCKEGFRMAGEQCVACQL